MGVSRRMREQIREVVDQQVREVLREELSQWQLNTLTALQMQQAQLLGQQGLQAAPGPDGQGEKPPPDFRRLLQGTRGEGQGAEREERSEPAVPGGEGAGDRGGREERSEGAGAGGDGSRGQTRPAVGMDGAVQPQGPVTGQGGTVAHVSGSPGAGLPVGGAGQQPGATVTTVGASPVQTLGGGVNMPGAAGGATAGTGSNTEEIAQVLGQAQMQLTQELETNLRKLKEVINESQQIARKLEMILGKDPEQKGNGKSNQ